MSDRSDLLQARGAGPAPSTRLSLESQPSRPPPAAAPSGFASRSHSHDISNLLTDPTTASAYLPSLPSLSQNSYLPTSLTSLGTTLTSSGTLPRPSTPGAKSVAQRRSQAPPLVQTELRKVSRDEFEPYLHEIQPDFEHWIRESKQSRQEQHSEEPHQKSYSNHDDHQRDRPPAPPAESLPPIDQVPSIFFDPAFNLSNLRTFDLVTERIQLTPHSSPALTFSPRLSSPNPALEVSIPEELTIPGFGPSTLNELAADQLLQDKLSHFTAVIESHLVREIGLRSSSFFSALSNLQHLHHQGSTTLVQIEQLKRLLQDRDHGVNATARHGLEILRLQARRRGLERLEDSVRQVEEMSSALEGVKELVENGEWQHALEVAEHIEDVFQRSSLASSPTVDAGAADPVKTSAATSSSRLNLGKLRALQSVPLKLSLVRAQIAKSLQGELISVLEHEMDIGTERAIKRARTRSNELARNPNRDEDDPTDDGIERTKERTRPVVQALVRSDGMDSAVQAWRESVLREVRAMVREHLPTGEGAQGDRVEEEEDPFASAAVRSVSKQSIDLGTISEKSLSLAKNLRAMPHEAFLKLAQETYLGLIACIETVQDQANVLLSLVAQSRQDERIRKSKRSVNGPTEPTSSSLTVPGSTPTAPAVLEDSTNPEDSPLATEISDVLSAVTELSNVRFSKVIGVRSEVHAQQLDLSQFLEVFDATWNFVLQCEVIVKRMIVGLRGAMVSQSKGWLMHFHQKRINENAKLVEEEQWTASEVSSRVQAKVEFIVKGAMEDPEQLLLGQRRKRDHDEGNGNGAVIQETLAKQVDIEGRQFFAVSAGLATIETLVEYLQVVLNCPMLTTDAMGKVIEFMKVFNSRSCQVVLGAGAMRSAGLKNITAKNLALASQALSIMVSLIPYIRELIRRHLNPKQAVMLTEFDKLKRDYQEHQYEIHAKLVAIMSDRLIVHSRSLEALDWEFAPSAATEKPGQPNAYMESLVKEHLTLYKVLSRFLHSETVFSIMSQVFKALDTKLGEEFGRIEFKTSGARERVLVDVRYLQEKLGGLKGLEESRPGQVLEALILAKTLPEKSMPPIAPSSPRTSTAEPTGSPSTLRAPSAAVETPLPVTPASLWTSLPTSASTSALSLALPEAPSTPRTSLDAPSLSGFSPPAPPRDRNRSPSPGPQPPSPVPVPAPLPPSPTPSPMPYKKKTLAERLAERISRKPTEAVPPQQRSSLEAARTSFEAPSLSIPNEQPKHEDDKLLEEVQREIPVWTPKGEKELEEVEKAVEKEIENEIAHPEEEKRLEDSCAEKEVAPASEATVSAADPQSNDDADGKVVMAETDETAVPVKEEPAIEPEHAKTQTEAIASSEPAPESTVSIEQQAVQDDAVQQPAVEAEPPIDALETSAIAAPTVVVPLDRPSQAPSDLNEEVQDSTTRPATDTPAVSAPSKEEEAIDHATSTDAAVPISTGTDQGVLSPTSISIPAASVPIPASTPSTPVSSPPKRSQPILSMPDATSPPPQSTNPARKKTLKERLAEAARRGSTGSSLVAVTSPTSAAAPALVEPTIVEEKANGAADGSQRAANMETSTIAEKETNSAEAQ
ncbi:Vps54p [Sporobolomyces koalae]|uniref:Vps54p n=1 Tax=Sporobolomyces koalae TaxID=500713 RepID=UPI0031705764